MEDYVCEVCGAKAWVLSQIKITACYGSEYDGADIMLNICPCCLDTVITQLGMRAGDDTTDKKAS